MTVCTTPLRSCLFIFSLDSLTRLLADLIPSSPDLLASGIRVLIYAGVEDFMCSACLPDVSALLSIDLFVLHLLFLSDYIGNLQWMEALDSHLHDEFNAAPLVVRPHLSTSRAPSFSLTSDDTLSPTSLSEAPRRLERSRRPARAVSPRETCQFPAPSARTSPGSSFVFRMQHLCLY